ncbi:hypothetical protein ACQPZP_04380 [Spirillospora sp. CA-142024]|uniref:hypothetical protein n=1 Tax=Spirillospora sp. CA-142024 TaxID=3240036 RepID=UPI003D8AC3C0
MTPEIRRKRRTRTKHVRTVRAFSAQIMLMLALGMLLLTAASPDNALWQSLLIPPGWTVACIMSMLHWEKMIDRLRERWWNVSADQEKAEKLLDRWGHAWLLLWLGALLCGLGWALLVLTSYLPQY